MIEEIIGRKKFSKSCIPIYKNFEYQIWKEETKDVRITKSNLIKLPYRTSADEIWNSAYSPKRRNISDTKLSTPKLMNEIRSYLSLDAAEFPSPAPTPTPKKEDESSVRPLEREILPSDLEYINQTIPTYYNYYYTAEPQYTPQNYYPMYIPFIAQPNAMQFYNNFSQYQNTNELLTGRIKFFDNMQNYGFFTVDNDGSDLFVHYDDFLSSGFTKEYIQMAKNLRTKFEFRKVNYYGKYNLSSKAVDIKVSNMMSIK